MDQTEKFLKEYNDWSSQSKFDDFKFITRLTPEHQEKLLSGALVNGWAFLFGPFYYLYLGLIRSVFYIILSLFFFSFGFYIGLLCYVVFALILSVRANKHYLDYLKRKKEKYQDFNPDADTPYFNITTNRLLILSLITGGVYLMYWIYRNAKVIRKYQKDRLRPVWQAIFMSFTSINVFRAISHSVKALGYEKDLNPKLSAWLVLFLTATYSYEYNGEEASLLSLEFLFGLVVIYWVMIFLTSILFVKYQKAIAFYSEKKNIPVAKITGWECFFVFIGCLINSSLIISTVIIILNLFIQ